MDKWDIIVGVMFIFIVWVFLFIVFDITSNIEENRECNEDDYVTYEDSYRKEWTYIINGEIYKSIYDKINNSILLTPLPCGNSGFSKYCDWEECVHNSEDK